MSENWESRGKEEIKYRGESYYTITPLPYYIARRKVLLQHLKQIVSKRNDSIVCDYGCGDGYYSSWLTKCNSKLMVDGVDIADSMLARCREEYSDNKRISFQQIDSHGELLEEGRYDLTLVIAVLAHISDEDVLEIIRNIKRSLCDTGLLVVFEQVGKHHVQGKNYVRRTISEYTKIFESTGMRIKKVTLIDFWMHRMFMERFIAKSFYKRQKGANDSDRRINANRNVFFRLLSTIFTALSIPRVFPDKKNGWGYALIEVEQLKGDY